MPISCQKSSKNYSNLLLGEKKVCSAVFVDVTQMLEEKHPSLRKFPVILKSQLTDKFGLGLSKKCRFWSWRHQKRSTAGLGLRTNSLATIHQYPSTARKQAIKSKVPNSTNETLKYIWLYSKRKQKQNKWAEIRFLRKI